MKTNLWTLCALVALVGCQQLALKDTVTEQVAAIQAENNPAAAPAFAPVSGVYSTDQTVTLTCATPGAAIYYAFDPDQVSTSSMKYTAPVTISGNGTSKILHAIAVKSGYKNSDVTTATYTIDSTASYKPKFSPDGGTYPADISTITISTTDADHVYYTTDGSTPTASSTLYSTPLSLLGDQAVLHLKAIGVKGAQTSSVTSATYTIQYPVAATPTISATDSLGPVDVSGLSPALKLDPTLTLATTTSGATVFYSWGSGNTVVTPATGYTTALVLNGNPAASVTKTLTYVAKKAGMADSPTVSKTFTVTYDPISITLTPAPGTINQNSMLSHSGPIYPTHMYYTTDGSLPTTSSTDWIGGADPFLTGAGAHRLRFLMMYPQRANTYLDNTWTIVYTDAQPPTVSPGPGTYTSDQAVHVTGYMSGDTIYYTTDGTTPTHSSPWFNYTSTDLVVPIGPSGTYSLKLLISHASLADSPVITYTYTINYPSNQVSTLAGGYNSNAAGYRNGVWKDAQFSSPADLTVDSAGNVYVADTGNNRVRKITSAGVVSTLAGNGSATDSDNSDPLQAGFNGPTALALDSANGYLYVADLGNTSGAVHYPGLRKIDLATGAVTSPLGFASTGIMTSLVYYNGVTQGAAGALVATHSYLVFARNDSSTGTTYGSVNYFDITSGQTYPYGVGSEGLNFGGWNSADSTFSRQLTSTGQIAVFGDGTHVPLLLLVDPTNHMALGFDARTTHATVNSIIAGNYGVSGSAVGSQSWAGYPNPVFLTGNLNSPLGIAYSSTAGMYVADTGNNAIRTTSGSGILFYAGATTPGYLDAVGTAARFTAPHGLALGSDGTLYVADTGNNAIRKIKP